MTHEGQLLTALAQTAKRRQTLGRVLLALAVLCLLWALPPHTWPWAARALFAALGTALFVHTFAQFQPLTAPTAADYARHLDARFPQLEDSTSLLLDSQNATPLVALQRNKVRASFASLEQRGQLRATLPPFAWRTLCAVWALALPGILLAGTLRATQEDPPLPAVTDTTQIARGRVSLRPPAYVGAEPTNLDTLDFATFADTEVTWQIVLSRSATSVQLIFHDGETLALEARPARRWRSPPWRARSSVYRVMVDNANNASGVFRIDAKPDQAPRILVTQPDQAIQVLPPGQRDTLNLTLQFEASDDYGIAQTRARVTLARGNGEQVEFREQAIDLVPQWHDNRHAATVTRDLDLMALGMAPGDELYVFAEAEDNRAPTPNVGTSDTFIVRWPGPEQSAAVTVATLAVPVLPEFFRSQRQIIIDTEKLIAERGDIDEASFAQRAQALAIDQKLLRLRYGQYLGEEDDSGIGSATQTQAEEDPDHDDHDHAGHADEAPNIDVPATGDAQAVIDLNAHMHDQEEEATLFEPATRELLRRALGQMWDAELHLRLAQPDVALPFEYAALGFIKEVQQSDRVYLRRTGFRPTPIDEERRLSGELDDIDSQKIDHDPRAASQDRRLRLLLSALTRGSLPAAVELSDLTDVVRTRALSEPSWLPALGAMERLLRDSSCTECGADLTRELWRQLDDTLPAPAARPGAVHPVRRAYDVRRNSAGDGARP